MFGAGVMAVVETTRGAAEVSVKALDEVVKVVGLAKSEVPQILEVAHNLSAVVHAHAGAPKDLIADLRVIHKDLSVIVQNAGAASKNKYLKAVVAKVDKLEVLLSKDALSNKEVKAVYKGAQDLSKSLAKFIHAVATAKELKDEHNTLVHEAKEVVKMLAYGAKELKLAAQKDFKAVKTKLDKAGTKVKAKLSDKAHKVKAELKEIASKIKQKVHKDKSDSKDKDTSKYTEKELKEKTAAEIEKIFKDAEAFVAQKQASQKASANASSSHESDQPTDDHTASSVTAIASVSDGVGLAGAMVIAAIASTESHPISTDGGAHSVPATPNVSMEDISIVPDHNGTAATAEPAVSDVAVHTEQPLSHDELVSTPGYSEVTA